MINRLRAALTGASIGLVLVGVVVAILKFDWSPWISSALVLAFLAMAEAMGERP